MDRPGGGAQRVPCPARSLSDDLAEDGDRHLLGRGAPDVKPAWGGHPPQGVVVDAALAQAAITLIGGAAAAERADVAGAGIQRRQQRWLVELGVVGEDEDRVARSEGSAGEQVLG